MFLVSFRKNHSDNHSHSFNGLIIPGTENILDLSEATPELPGDMLSLIALGDSAISVMEKALQSDKARLPLSAVTLLAPIPVPPRNIFCVGKNYPEHVQEVQSVVASAGDNKGDAPSSPIIFTKAPSSVIGPMEPIPAWLDETESVDY